MKINTLAVLGATGQTGQYAVRYALGLGLNVRALVRDPGRLLVSDDRLEMVVGNALNADSIAELLRGSDAVVSALGPTDYETGLTVCSQTASHLAALMPKAGISRYVAVSGASLAVPSDKFSLRGRFFSTAALILTKMNRQLNLLLLDKKNEYIALKDSRLNWTLVRPPYIVPGEYLRDAKVTPFTLQGSKVRVGELARALVDLALKDLYAGQAVFINSEGG